MPNAVLKLGHVVAVNGARITGIFNPVSDTLGNSPDQTLEELTPEFGSLVKITTRTSAVFGIVSGQSITEVGSDLATAQQMMTIDLLGEVMNDEDGRPGTTFRRGVSVHPRLGAPILATLTEDLEVVYAKPMAPCVRVGMVHGDQSLPAYVATDGLLGKHFAVLGTTGCGKSCTVALILRSILDRHNSGHIIVLDPHNEYSAAFGDRAEVVNPTNLQLPYWLMNFDELCGAFVSSIGPERQTEATILKQAVTLARRNYIGDADEAAHITVDTPSPFRLGELEHIISNQMGRLNKAEGSLPYLRLLARIESLRNDRRFEFMFSGLVVRDTMCDVLSRLLRVPVCGKPVTVVDLSGVPSEIVDVVVALLCRMTFDFAIWSVCQQAVPVLIVAEEAHRYVGQDDNGTFSLTREAIARIAKEGRKYGVSLCLVTQRPAELSTTILSQCNTIFALRMSNEHDQNFVRRALPDSASGLLAVLPALHMREAIVVGEGVSVPMRVRFDDLEAAARPRGSTARFSKAWEHDIVPREFVQGTILRWRYQLRDDEDGSACRLPPVPLAESA